jgi:hypothetical protein
MAGNPSLLRVVRHERRTSRHSRQAPVASTRLSSGVSAVLNLTPGCSTRRSSRRMAVPQLTSRTVAAEPRYGARDPPICASVPTRRGTVRAVPNGRYVAPGMGQDRIQGTRVLTAGLQLAGPGCRGGAGVAQAGAPRLGLPAEQRSRLVISAPNEI